MSDADMLKEIYTHQVKQTEILGDIKGGLSAHIAKTDEKFKAVDKELALNWRIWGGLIATFLAGVIALWKFALPLLAVIK